LNVFVKKIGLLKNLVGKKACDMGWHESVEFNKVKGKEEAELFIKNNQNCFIFEVEYEDDGDNMENRLKDSTLIDKVNCKIFSHH